MSKVDATSVDDDTAFLFFKMKLCRYPTQDASIKINERRYEQLCRQWNKESSTRQQQVGFVQRLHPLATYW